MKEAKQLILEDLDFGFSILNNSAYRKYGCKDKKELTNILNEMKIDGLIFYKECEHPMFKGEPEGKINITPKGKTYIISSN